MSVILTTISAAAVLKGAVISLPSGSNLTVLLLKFEKEPERLLYREAL